MSTPGAASLAGYQLVYFGNDWRAENRTSSHHIAVRLAQRVPVLYVDSPGLRAPQGNRRDLKRLFRKLGEAVRPPTKVADNLWHCTVPQLPYRAVPGVAALNRAAGRFAVMRAIRGLGFDNVISWFVVPHPGFLARRLDERLCVYYCIDDYAAHPGVDSERIGRQDLELTRVADQVFVAPPSLVEAKKAVNATATYSPHGVDVELFSGASDPATVVPEAARNLPRPVIGYFGSIAQWIDVELLVWLARERPAWTFLFVGHAHADVSALAALPNVRLVGPQPYATLPAWAKAFDVAIIPYRDVRQVANANPLKLREYLATGRPVVAAPNAEIRKFERWVRIASGRAEFLAALEAALQPEPASAARERIAAVAPFTWDRRVEEIIATVSQRIQQLHLNP